MIHTMSTCLLNELCTGLWFLTFDKVIKCVGLELDYVFEYFQHNMTCKKSTNTKYYAYIKILKLTMKLDKITPNDYIKKKIKLKYQNLKMKIN